MIILQKQDYKKLQKEGSRGIVVIMISHTLQSILCFIISTYTMKTDQIDRKRKKNKKLQIGLIEKIRCSTQLFQTYACLNIKL